MPDSGHTKDGLPTTDEPANLGAMASETSANIVTDVERWVVEHHQALYRYAYRLCGSSADAEDLTQQVYLIAQQKAAQCRNPQQVRGWLFTILRNCYLKIVRRHSLPTQVGPDFDIQQIPAEALAAPLDTERLQDALNDLSDEFKLVVLMFYFEHRSYREIAEQLEIPTGTVMSRLARAKAQLRGKLIDAEDRPVVTARTDSVHEPAAAFHPSNAIRPTVTRH